MKLGFSAIAQAGGDQDRHDAGAFGLAVLAHFNDGRLALHLNYDFRAGVELANDVVFDRETRLEADLPPAPGAAEGANPSRSTSALASCSSA